MRLVKPSISVLEGGAGKGVRSPLEAASDHFRLERQGDLVSPATLEHYDAMVVPFLSWVSEGAGVRRFEDLDVVLVRAYRAELATRPGKKHGRPLQARTIFDSHRALLTFFRWASAEGYAVEPRILELKRPRVPEKEPTVFHVRQVQEILAACNPRVPRERARKQAALAHISRFCRLGRASGIHVILCTQRPDADAVPGQLKANIPATVAFRVREETNSRILLGEGNEAAAVLPPWPGRGIWQWDTQTSFKRPG